MHANKEITSKEMLLKISRNIERKAFGIIPPLSKPISSQSYTHFCSKIIRFPSCRSFWIKSVFYTILKKNGYKINCWITPVNESTGEYWYSYHWFGIIYMSRCFPQRDRGSEQKERLLSERLLIKYIFTLIISKP